ncbi:MAG: sigE 17 [Verrucomicrobiales bacterium]|nr:sigE 17 [Verrucomicrobiales bacterium]
METESDSDLLLQGFIRDGNSRAFEELVGGHAPHHRGLALRCTGDPAETNEVTQAVFTLLARKASSLKDCHLSGWMHNAAFPEVRKSKCYWKALRKLNTQVNLMHPPPSRDSEDSSGAERARLLNPSPQVGLFPGWPGFSSKGGPPDRC